MGRKKSSGKKSTKKKPVKEEKKPEEKETSEEAPKEARKEEVKAEPLEDKDAIDKDDEYAIQILGWATAGYDTSKLEELFAGKSRKKFEREFKKFSKAIKRIEEMKKEVEELNISGVEDEIQKLVGTINDPYKLKESEKQLEMIKRMVKAKDMENELKSMMSVEGLRKKAENVKKMLKDLDNLEKAEEELKDLRREFKEEYFVSEFVEMIEEKPREVKKIKITEEKQKSRRPMQVLDLFIFAKGGKFLGHKTSRKGMTDRKELVEKLNIARDFVKNEQFRAGVLIKVPKGGETLLLHKGELVSIGILISGEPHKLTGKLLKKGAEMIEKENAPVITGKEKSDEAMKHLKKNMGALMYAAMKLGDEMKK